MDSSGFRMPCPASASRPATPAVPVSSASMPVAPQASALAARRSGSSTTTRAAAGDEHRPHDREPVVGLVVEDPVGDARGLRLPRPHVARPVVRHAAQAVVDDGRDRRVCRRRGPGPRAPARRRGRAARRRGPGRCRGSGRVSMAPIAAASSKPRAIPDASAPPPTWTTIRSSDAPAARSSSAISQASVAPPSIARPLSGPWQVNGTAPAARASWSRRYEGSPASPGRRGQVTTTAPSVAQAVDDGGVGALGDEHPQLARPRPGRRRRRRGRRCRSSRWRGGSPDRRRPAPRPPAAPAGSRTGGAPCASRPRCRSRP